MYEECKLENNYVVCVILEMLDHNHVNVWFFGHHGTNVVNFVIIFVVILASS